jgi:hypothetical protein
MTGGYLDWPFFDDRHRVLANRLEAWASANLAAEPGPDVDAACRLLVRRLGEAGWLKYAIGGSSDGTEAPTATIDTRAICLIR